MQRSNIEMHILLACWKLLTGLLLKPRTKLGALLQMLHPLLSFVNRYVDKNWPEDFKSKGNSDSTEFCKYLMLQWSGIENLLLGKKKTYSSKFAGITLLSILIHSTTSSLVLYKNTNDHMIGSSFLLPCTPTIPSVRAQRDLVHKIAVRLMIHMLRV